MEDEEGHSGEYEGSDMDEGEYDDEEQDEYGEMSGEYGEHSAITHEKDTSSLDFGNMPEYAHLPPLDPWRKIRRDLLAAINQSRFEEKRFMEMNKEEDEIDHLNSIYTDLLANEAAQEYARIVLEEDEDPEHLQELLNGSKSVGRMTSITAITFLEDDSADPSVLKEAFLDNHGLLVEMHRDLLLREDINHVGIGCALQDMRICLVYCFSVKPLTVTEIFESEEGGIEVQGIMLVKDVGLWAVRLVESMSQKERLIVGPQHIDFKKKDLTFTVDLRLEEGITYSADGSGAYLIEMFVRKKPETIPYKQASNEKISIKHVELVHRMMLQHFPDPRTLIEDATDADRKEKLEANRAMYEAQLKQAEQEEAARREQIREQQRKVLEEEEAKRQQMLEQGDEGSASATSRSDKLKGQSVSTPAAQAKEMTPDPTRSHRSSISSSKEVLDRPSDLLSDNSLKPASQQSSLYQPSGSQPGSPSMRNEEFSQEFDQEISRRELREELLLGIEDAIKQQQELSTINSAQQRKIVTMKQKLEGMGEPTGEVSMNEHKYLNTLANVHQLRFQLKEVQEQYNRWANVYEENLYEKQERCMEIKNYFRDLKREVALSAEYNRTGKSIGKGLISKWEKDEADKDKEVQECRIQNIRLKKQLEKLEDQLKDKEKLAPGLHLIDYEQLKIENQTLNEKIEERNEELHKLKNKIMKTVQILTHTREKLQFVQAEQRALKQLEMTMQEELKKVRTSLNTEKKNLKSLRDKNARQKQKTGIVTRKELNQDLERIDSKIAELEAEVKSKSEQVAQPYY
mmetsp:Transcript_9577/g.18670  ORF Transcript_9577/g.18670 Transcript_9577/m.18670 type:complete len:799 (+) Transcript_9577:1780-4176(+)